MEAPSPIITVFSLFCNRFSEFSLEMPEIFRKRVFGQRSDPFSGDGMPKMSKFFRIFSISVAKMWEKFDKSGKRC